jgi:ParB-like chromosome segregation protein Spo0J
MSDPTPSEPQPADAYQISEVALTDVRMLKRLRPLDLGVVERLAASMKAEGLRHPIAVRQTPEGFDFVHGQHRLEAARKLNWRTIRASIFFEMGPDQAAVAEVESNLVSRLTPDEYEKLIASREETVEVKQRQESHRSQDQYAPAPVANRRPSVENWKTAARRFFRFSSTNPDA